MGSEYFSDPEQCYLAMWSDQTKKEGWYVSVNVRGSVLLFHPNRPLKQILEAILYGSKPHHLATRVFIVEVEPEWLLTAFGELHALRAEGL